jgi:CheY-like chemotaxis protein
MLMPEMDGFEMLATLRVSGLNHLPMAWLVTASGDEAIIDDAPKVGFADVLLKPMSASSLHEALLKHLFALLDRDDREALPEKTPHLKPAAVLMRDYPGLRVLLAEDDPVNQEVAREILEEINWQTDLAGNGQEAVELATRTRYDLILMDMQMPVMGGLEATRQIRAMPACKTVPIVAMTANAFIEDREACLVAGMNDFLTKPVIPEKFFECILNWVSKPG